MPIAITPEHNDLADSVRSLVARVAPSEVLHEALETPIPNPPPYWKAAAEQGLQGVHLSGIRWRTRLRHPRTGDRHRRVRLRRGTRPVRAVGDRQRADRRARPRGQAAQRPGLRRRRRRLRHRLRAYRDPTRRRAWSFAARCGRFPRPRRRRCWCCRWPIDGDSGEEWVVLDADAAGDRTRQERRPAATAGPRARQRRRGRRRSRAEQPEPDPGPGADRPRCCPPSPSASHAGPPTPRRRTPRSASSSAVPSASSRPSSTSAPR